MNKDNITENYLRASNLIFVSAVLNLVGNIFFNYAASSLYEYLNDNLFSNIISLISWFILGFFARKKHKWVLKASIFFLCWALIQLINKLGYIFSLSSSIVLMISFALNITQIILLLLAIKLIFLPPIKKTFTMKEAQDENINSSKKYGNLQKIFDSLLIFNTFLLFLPLIIARLISLPHGNMFGESGAVLLAYVVLIPLCAIFYIVLILLKIYTRIKFKALKN